MLPLDRARVIQPSAFSGIALDDEVTLPVAFVKSRHAVHFIPARGRAPPRRAARLPRGGAASPARRASARRETYLAAKDATLIRAGEAVKIDRLQHAPA